MQRLTKFFMLFLFLGTLFSACQKDIDKYNRISLSKWEPSMSVPFAKSTITFRDIIGNDSSIITNSDSSLVYVYHQDSVISISADSLLQFSPQVSQQYTFSLGAIHFNNFSDSSRITINDILPYLNSQTGDTLQKYNGTQNIFPPFSILNDFTLDMPEFSDYSNLEFSEGTLDIVATNELPVLIDTIAYDVIDVSNQQILKTIIIYDLAAGATNTESINLAGKTLGNKLKVVVHTFSSQGSNPDNVLIDLSKGVFFKFSAHDLTVISGTAKISQQQLLSETKILDLSTDKGERLYNITIADGTLDYAFQSNFNFGILARLTLSSALKDNQIPEQSFSVSANNNINSSWLLSGTMIDLTTDNNYKFNRVPIDIRLDLAETDNLVTFDSSNKITALFNLNTLHLASAEGYLGQQTHQFDNDGFSIDLNFLDDLTEGLLFTNSEIVLNYRNDFSVPIKAKINLLAIKNESGETQNLNFDSVTFKYPLVEGQTVYGSIDINRDNSSIVDFLSLIPDSVSFSGGFITNPNGLATNFINQTDIFTADADIKIPLNFQTSGIVYDDTIQDVHISPDDIPADSGTIVAGISNGFPFDIAIKLIFPDSLTGETLRTLDFGTIHSASVNSEGTENTPTNSLIRVPIPYGFFDDVQKANKVIVHLTVTTFNQGSIPVQIFADDKVIIVLGVSATIAP